MTLSGKMVRRPLQGGGHKYQMKVLWPAVCQLLGQSKSEVGYAETPAVLRPRCTVFLCGEALRSQVMLLCTGASQPC